MGGDVIGLMMIDEGGFKSIFTVRAVEILLQEVGNLIPGDMKQLCENMLIKQHLKDGSGSN